MLGGSGKEADAGPGAAVGARTVGRTVLAAGLLAALAAPSSASAAPARAAAKLKAASAPASQLTPVAAIPLPGGATAYRFQQRVSGVKVLNGQVVISDRRGTPPDLVADSSKPSIERPPSPRVGKTPAAEIAVRRAGVRRLRGHWSASLAIEPGDGGTLVWRVVIPSARPLGDFEVLIDATSGAVVRKRNLIQDFRTGRAQLYNPNPVVAHDGTTGLRRDRHDRDTGLLTLLRRPVKLPKIRSRQHCLRGKWAHAKLGHKPRRVCKRNLRWRGAKRSKDRFEALMTYFHITRAQRYIQTLGFSDTTGNGINDRTQVVIADAKLVPRDNSFFLPVTRRIKFGFGGVDDAEDADVILHEYGHALQDSQLRFFGDGLDAGSIGEGFGDYWAAAMSSRSPGTRNRDDVCIFDWDGIVWGSFAPAYHRRCGRRADNPQNLTQARHDPECQYPAGPQGLDVHCIGTVWSSALWDLRLELGRDTAGHPIMDKDVLASHFFYTATNEHFDDAANALLSADRALYPDPSVCPGPDCAGLHESEITVEMQDRKFLP